MSRPRRSLGARRRLRAAFVVVVLLGTGAWVGPAAAQEAPTHPGSLGPAPTHSYVQRVHQLFLDRTASPAEARDLAHLVHVGGPAALTSRLALSPEWAGTRIDDLYRTVLGRSPDPGGQAHWLDQLRRGRTLESVAAGFYGSDEYYAKVGGRADAYVDSLYRGLLGRAPDPDGRQHWLDRMRAGMSREAVAGSFYGSLESRRQRVDALYAEVLDRVPDPGGRAHWVERLPALGDVALAASLASSDEMHRRATGVPLPDVRVAPVGAGTPYPLSASWRPGCPVGPGDLRALTFPHFRPDGSIGRGVLIVHRDATHDVAVLVRAAYGSRFPITQARVVDDFGGDDGASMAADNTSAFNCRVVAGTTTWSQHAYGRAVDFNPVRNPYVRGGQVDPPAGAAYVDRSDVRPGMLVEGGAVIDAVDRRGWGWGGRWTSGADHQHVSRNGR
jgi:poly-gamma-glutamate synthesis protein (capsule biosynthesis protein)